MRICAVPIQHFLQHFLASFSLIALLTACVSESDNDSSSNDNASSPDLLAFFAHYADDIIIPNYQLLYEQTAQLANTDGHLANYCTELANGTHNVESQAAAVSDWKSAMRSWQAVNLHHVGPITESSFALRNRFSSYEDNNLARCGLDQAVVLFNTTDAFSLTNRSSNQRGFSAIEYLLAEDSLTQNCPSQVSETQDWNERPELERRVFRCSYAQALAQDMQAASETLLKAWLPDGNNYRQAFIDPSNQAENLNALSDALFYLDVTIKDKKLKFPFRLEGSNPRANCQAISCPESLESPFTQVSMQNIRENLISFRTLLNSGNAIGFDDFFIAADLPNLLPTFNTNIDAALTLISESQLSLVQQAELLTTDENSRSFCDNTFLNPDVLPDNSTLTACAIAGFIKRISDDLKIGFVTALNVNLPRRAQSDND